MKRNLGYIVLAVSGFIYMLYNLTVTSAILYILPNRTLALWETTVAEVSAFIPIGVLFLGLLKLSEEKEEFFEKFSLKTFFIHSLLLLLFIGFHSFWQVLSNSFFISGAIYNGERVLIDAITFLNMRVMVYLITIGLIVGVKRIEEKESFELKESELRLKLERAKVRKIELKLNPDIIYPSLSYIKKNLHERPDESSSLLLNLSKQMRILIDNLDEETIPIKEDTRFFKYYFKNVEIRLGRDLTVIADIDEALRNIQIPSMVLLAPFFENLFFGFYKEYTKKVDKIIYRSHKAREGFIKLSMQLESIDQGKYLSRSIQNDTNFTDLIKILQHYEGSSLESILERDSLFLILDFKYTSELEKVYAG